MSPVCSPQVIMTMVMVMMMMMMMIIIKEEIILEIITKCILFSAKSCPERLQIVYVMFFLLLVRRKT